jgi:threonine synthase
MDYRQLAYAILSRLVDDIPAADLKALVDKTYNTSHLQPWPPRFRLSARSPPLRKL